MAKEPRPPKNGTHHVVLVAGGGKQLYEQLKVALLLIGVEARRRLEPDQFDEPIRGDELDGAIIFRDSSRERRGRLEYRLRERYRIPVVKPDPDLDSVAAALTNEGIYGDEIPPPSEVPTMEALAVEPHEQGPAPDTAETPPPLSDTRPVTMQSIREIRKSLGLTTKQVGNLIGMGDTLIHNIEVNPNKPVSDLVLTALEALLQLAPQTLPRLSKFRTTRWGEYDLDTALKRVAVFHAHRAHGSVDEAIAAAFKAYPLRPRATATAPRLPSASSGAREQAIAAVDSLVQSRGTKEETTDMGKRVSKELKAQFITVGELMRKHRSDLGITQVQALPLLFPDIAYRGKTSAVITRLESGHPHRTSDDKLVAIEALYQLPPGTIPRIAIRKHPGYDLNGALTRIARFHELRKTMPVEAAIKEASKAKPGPKAPPPVAAHPTPTEPAPSAALAISPVNGKHAEHHFPLGSGRLGTLVLPSDLTDADVTIMEQKIPIVLDMLRLHIKLGSPV